MCLCVVSTEKNLVFVARAQWTKRGAAEILLRRPGITMGSDIVDGARVVSWVLRQVTGCGLSHRQPEPERVAGTNRPQDPLQKSSLAVRACAPRYCSK